MNAELSFDLFRLGLLLSDTQGNFGGFLAAGTIGDLSLQIANLCSLQFKEVNENFVGAFGILFNAMQSPPAELLEATSMPFKV